MRIGDKITGTITGIKLMVPLSHWIMGLQALFISEIKQAILKIFTNC